MKRLFALLLCLLMLTGCASYESSAKNTLSEDELLELRREAYRCGYREGYEDAVEAVVDNMPGEMISVLDLEDNLSGIIEDDAYADYVYDKIKDYCEIYDRADFSVDYTDHGMSYTY